jgi:pimeloyl-ACP methyl ester carboxylesterase
LVPPSPKSVLRLASFMGERATLAGHSDLVDLFVAAGRDPIAASGLLVWGEQEPLGSVSVAQAVTELIPHARLEVLPTGHAPWLGQPAQTAATVVDFVR